MGNDELRALAQWYQELVLQLADYSELIHVCAPRDDYSHHPTVSVSARPQRYRHHTIMYLDALFLPERMSLYGDGLKPGGFSYEYADPQLQQQLSGCLRQWLRQAGVPSR